MHFLSAVLGWLWVLGLLGLALWLVLVLVLHLVLGGVLGFLDGEFFLIVVEVFAQALFALAFFFCLACLEGFALIFKEIVCHNAAVCLCGFGAAVVRQDLWKVSLKRVRLRMERPKVSSSVYSISLPTLTPRASMVIFTSGYGARRRKM